MNNIKAIRARFKRVHRQLNEARDSGLQLPDLLGAPGVAISEIRHNRLRLRHMAVLAKERGLYVGAVSAVELALVRRLFRAHYPQRNARTTEAWQRFTQHLNLNW